MTPVKIPPTHCFESGDSASTSEILHQAGFGAMNGDLFKSTDSDFLSSLMKSGDIDMKSQDSATFLSGLTNSDGDRFKSGGDLFTSTGTFSMSGSLMNSNCSNILNSREWFPTGGFPDDDVKAVFDSESSRETSTKAGKTKGLDELYFGYLSSIPRTAGVKYPAQISVEGPYKPESVEDEEWELKQQVEPSEKKPMTKRRRCRPSYEPKVKEYVKRKEMDVLCGRGGLSNKNPGNIRYRIEKERMQPRYMTATKVEKTGISQELVAAVSDWGGRFLKHDRECKQWYIVTEIAARKKASQTLRELNTPEKRAAKRARYRREK